jgi:hypothetical protein
VTVKQTLEAPRLRRTGHEKQFDWYEQGQSVEEMLRCQCKRFDVVPCDRRMTQEDLLCNECRPRCAGRWKDVKLKPGERFKCMGFCASKCVLEIREGDESPRHYSK